MAGALPRAAYSHRIFTAPSRLLHGGRLSFATRSNPSCLDTDEKEME